jgi:O-antigen/teichoic acid export membrane protein
MTFYNRIDTVMIGKLLPKEVGELQAGIYAHAYRILEATNQISFLFAVLLLPLFSHLISQKQKLNNIIRVSFSLLFVGTFILAVNTVFYSYELMDLLYESDISESAGVYNILIFGVVAMGTSYIFGTLLTANGNLKELNIIASVSLFLSLLLNFILVPRIQAQGSAIANVVALSISAVLQLIVVRRKFAFKLEIRYFGVLFVFLIVSLLISYISTLLIDVSWMIRIIGSAILSLFVAIVLKLLNVKEFIQYVKDDAL